MRAGKTSTPTYFPPGESRLGCLFVLFLYGHGDHGKTAGAESTVVKRT